MAKSDRRIKKTREAIHQALIALMAEKSFEHITINHISEKADLNRGTIYLHFADKYDLLDQCMQARLDAMATFCTLSRPGEEDTDIARSLLPMFRYFEEHYAFFSSMLADKGITCFRERLIHMVQNGLIERLLTEASNREARDEVAVQFMASAYVGVVEWWIKHRMPLSPEVMAGKLWDMLELHYAAIRLSSTPG
ncbi:TetR/AcrR family transcriptional regulator [Paenibacillus glycinis]|uniref:TetR family transcriptional regulator n=1 Tax=Paenibacillus glycinis TaxID=2697035 RepID=A0ABW9XZP9_9BACL|nr:TetR/AcrR family transcriptional regulator [Paenibacillus glycinis]NBD28171.1 TetR family transcriptional regulator [Paenibacillus glycinis]